MSSNSVCGMNRMIRISVVSCMDMSVQVLPWRMAMAGDKGDSIL